MSDNDELSLNIEEPAKKTGPGLITVLKEKMSLKLVIIISVTLVLIAGGIVAFLLFTGGDADSEDPEMTEETTKELTMAAPVILFDDIVTLNVVEIKLSDLGGEKIFSVGIHCKIDQEDVRNELEEKSAEAAEIITMILKSKTYVELSGVDGKILLRNEIIRNLNEILETGRVMNLYFYEFLIL